jgi:hypothetical protein
MRVLEPDLGDAGELFQGLLSYTPNTIPDVLL